VPALRDLYDEIWIYGLPQINKPLTGIAAPPSVRHKMVYTGYLHRDLPLHTDVPHEAEEIDGPYILVTPGGGGDGVDLVDWVLAAYEADPNIPYGAVIVFGPFMASAARESFKERAAKFRNIRTLTFTNNLGALMKDAAGVVAMGGYNTFCEILSFDKRAIIVPRTRPRLEQFIRTRAARNLGLLEMLEAERGRDPHTMATALRQLPQQGLPSDVVVPGLLDGIGNVLRLVHKQLANPHRRLGAIMPDEPAEDSAASTPSARRGS
jgi:predicted glycosyltransferase